MLHTVSVHNRFVVLSNNVEGVTERYKGFVQDNNEAAEKLLLVKKKSNLAEDPRIEVARKHIQKAFLNYQQQKR